MGIGATSYGRIAYNKLSQEQQGRCAICGATEDGRKHAIDHDHRNGAIRGLLCANCNLGLGYFRDDPAILTAALRYLGHKPPVLSKYVRTRTQQPAPQRFCECGRHIPTRLPAATRCSRCNDTGT